MPDMKETIQTPDQSLTDNNIQTDDAAVSWDADSMIHHATCDYINSLQDPKSMDCEVLKAGCMNAINSAIAERNVLQGGTKIRQYSCLPPASISALMQAKYHIKAISWLNKRTDQNIIGIYTEDGPSAGVYNTERAFFNQIGLRRLHFINLS